LRNTGLDRVPILPLFNTIALEEGTQIQIQKLGLTSKEYYSRISRLTKTELITKRNDNYYLTLLGKILYEIHVMTCKVLKYHWKLKAVKSIQTSAPGCSRLPEEEFYKLVDILIDDSKIKDMVMGALTTTDLTALSDNKKKINKLECN
jgi:hypothetical protein